MVDIGVIRLAEGADVARVRAGLEQSSMASARLRILTVAEMIGRERAFWQIHTPIGQIFWLGVILGFIVGMVICYQVLSSDIRDHLAEYATLKAIGYGNTYLVKVVCRQAVWLALLGFAPPRSLQRSFIRSSAADRAAHADGALIRSDSSSS